jgi:Acyl-CoA synthetases (AMP-forming)/AMP-acid ligases II
MPPMMPRMTDHRPWFASYPNDVRPCLEPYPHESLFAILDAAAGRYPNKPALAWFGKHMTYAQLLEEVERCSAMLTALGVTKGDRVR